MVWVIEELVVSKKLPDIPKCKACGREVIGGSAALCRECQLKRANEDYQKVVRAERSMSGDSSWQSGYSPWMGIVIIPAVIIVLILLVVVMVMVSSSSGN